tara:strand:+ start:258 stop:647 length:390 start_codon:yes stop_codon:yes gene_type:complete
MGLNTVASNLISKTFANTLVSGLTLSQSATWVKRTAGTYTPLTGAMGSQTETNVSINVIEQDYSTSEILASGGAILNTDRRVLAKPVTDVDFEDSIGDSLTIGSRTHRILSLRRVILGTDELVWEAQCR